MKTHAPSGKKRSARFATATIALFAALAPASAWALEIPVPTAEQACPATGIETVAPLQVAVQTKSEAILGGTRSKLEELKAQQAAAAAVAIAPAPAPMVQLAMLSPAAGPAAIAAPCTALAFARLPQTAQETTLAPRARATQWVARLAAVSIARRPQLDSGLLLQPVDTSKPNVFGSVALAIGRTPLDNKWQRAQAAKLPRRGGEWRTVVGEARDLDQGRKLDMINSWVNRRVNFIDDSARFKVADRWATAAETLRAGQGDCEDYAIAKMKLLEASGVSTNDMFLVIAKDLVRRADHALLVVRNGDRLVVLDNNTDRIVDAAAISDYRPVMSYSAGKAWLHGYATQPAPIMQAPIRIAALTS